jgi:4-aminobutyrate aminotransferase-like enzyme/Ser/Thr protein kinase RdoA (MazF antagonist)
MDESLSASADPLETPPPSFSLEEAATIAGRVFGLSCVASALDSERDQNFRLLSDDGESFLLKISNSADDTGSIEMQTLAMVHITRQAPGLPVMQPLASVDGGRLGEVEGSDGQKHLVRLFTFLPGRMAESADLDADAVHAFGSVVARIGIALRGFFHPAGGYSILWDLKHTSGLRPLLSAVADANRRAIAEQVLDRFDKRVAPSLPGLRSQLIHNDLTLDNVLLDDKHRVSGVVDFGDLTHTALICDLAIALVSVMWGRPDPLESADAAISGYKTVLAIEQSEADVLADLVSARLTALAVIAAWRVQRYPENAAYITANEELAWELLESFDAIGFSEVQQQLRTSCTQSRAPFSRTRPSVQELAARRQRVLGPALSPLTYEHPLYLVRGEGSQMFDHKGVAYLDAYNNVPVVGHCHPRVVAAVAEQTSELNTNTRYLHESVIELAERIAATMPRELDTVMFVNSGTEANDIAWRLATTYTGGTGGIVTSRAYHGVSTATIALSPEEWPAGEHPGHVETVPAPDGFRGPHRCEELDWIDRYLECMDWAIAELERRDHRAAAFYLDPLFTSDGIFTPPTTFIQHLVDLVRKAGGLFVADEVQCGFGRIGSHLWSFEGAGVTPDFVTLGKPMGNGYPVAAVVTRSEIAQRFATTSDMFSTFGGNPVACRAALAVLDVIEDEGLQQRALGVGARLRTNLESLKTRHTSIGDVRGLGLMIGVELVDDEGSRAPAPKLTDAVLNRMKNKRVLVGVTGPESNVLKIRPPLVLSLDEADLISEALDASLSELAGEGL